MSTPKVTKRTLLRVQRAPDRTPFSTAHTALVDARCVESDEPETPGQPRFADAAEPTSTLDTPLGRVYVRSRRFRFMQRTHDAEGFVVYEQVAVYEVAVTTEIEAERARTEARKPRSVVLDAPHFHSHLEAHLFAMDVVEAHVAARLAADARAAARRPIPPAETTREALRRLLHKLGTMLEKTTGEDWNSRRPEISRSYGVRSSNDLTQAQLSDAVDKLKAELERLGVTLPAPGRPAAPQTRPAGRRLAA